MGVTDRPFTRALRVARAAVRSTPRPTTSRSNSPSYRFNSASLVGASQMMRRASAGPQVAGLIEGLSVQARASFQTDPLPQQNDICPNMELLLAS